MSLYRGEEKRMIAGMQRADSELDRKFWIALLLYAFLAGMVWFTMGEGRILVHGRLVELRLVPLMVIGGMVLKTVLARQAERIRRRDEAKSETAGDGSSGQGRKEEG